MRIIALIWYIGFYFSWNMLWFSCNCNHMALGSLLEPWNLFTTWICLFFLGIQTFKWQDYISWQKKLNEARASAAALKAGTSGMRIEGEPPKSKWRSFFRKSPIEDVQVTKNNIYDKGFFHNLLEIIFPLSMRSSFLQTKSKSGWNFQ